MKFLPPPCRWSVICLYSTCTNIDLSNANFLLFHPPSHIPWIISTSATWTHPPEIGRLESMSMEMEMEDWKSDWKIGHQEDRKWKEANLMSQRSPVRRRFDFHFHVSIFLAPQCIKHLRERSLNFDVPHLPSALVNRAAIRSVTWSSYKKLARYYANPFIQKFFLRIFIFLGGDAVALRMDIFWPRHCLSNEITLRRCQRHFYWCSRITYCVPKYDVICEVHVFPEENAFASMA